MFWATSSQAKAKFHALDIRSSEQQGRKKGKGKWQRGENIKILCMY